MYYKDGEWVASDLDATILPLREMFEKTSDFKLGLKIVYLIIKL